MESTQYKSRVTSFFERCVAIGKTPLFQSNSIRVAQERREKRRERHVRRNGLSRDTFLAQGNVKSLEAGTLIIGNESIRVTADTWMIGNIRSGKKVEVHGFFELDGSRTAKRIRLLSL